MRSLCILVLTASLGSVLPGCSSLTQSWKEPEVSLVGIQPKELGLMHQVFLVTLLVKNPNDRTLPIKGMTYRLAVEGQEIAHGSSELDREIPAHGQARADVEVIGSLAGLAQQLPLLTQSDRPLAWTITGRVGVAGGLIQLPYSRSGTLDPKSLAR